MRHSLLFTRWLLARLDRRPPLLSGCERQPQRLVAHRRAVPVAAPVHDHRMSDGIVECLRRVASLRHLEVELDPALVERVHVEDPDIVPHWREPLLGVLVVVEVVVASSVYYEPPADRVEHASGVIAPRNGRGFAGHGELPGHILADR